MCLSNNNREGISGDSALSKVQNYVKNQVYFNDFLKYIYSVEAVNVF